MAWLIHVWFVGLDLGVAVDAAGGVVVVDEVDDVGADVEDRDADLASASGTILAAERRAGPGWVPTDLDAMGVEVDQSRRCPGGRACGSYRQASWRMGAARLEAVDRRPALVCLGSPSATPLPSAQKRCHDSHRSGSAGRVMNGLSGKWNRFSTSSGLSVTSAV